MIVRLLLALLLLLPISASAQQRTFQSTFLEGSWALRLEGAIVMRWDLELTEDGWAGGWTKPTSFSSDGTRFGNIVMPAVERRADSGKAIGDWAEITFNDPRPGEEPDQFRFKLLGPDRAEMIYVGTGLPPFSLVRVGEGALLGPFEEGKVYGQARQTPAAGPSPAPSPSASATPRPTPSSSPSTAPRPVPSPSATLTPVAPRPSPSPSPSARATPAPTDQPVQGPPAIIGR